MSKRRVNIKAILADPKKRREMMISTIVATQAREGIETTWEQAAEAYDNVVDDNDQKEKKMNIISRILVVGLISVGFTAHSANANIVHDSIMILCDGKGKASARSKIGFIHNAPKERTLKTVRNVMIDTYFSMGNERNKEMEDSAREVAEQIVDFAYASSNTFDTNTVRGFHNEVTLHASGESLDCIDNYFSIHSYYIPMDLSDRCYVFSNMHRFANVSRYSNMSKDEVYSLIQFLSPFENNVNQSIVETAFQMPHVSKMIDKIDYVIEIQNWHYANCVSVGLDN